MGAFDVCRKWLDFAKLDAKLRAELDAAKNDTKEIEDRFYKDLEFGTGGLRGLLGAGTNRMNIYTVRRAAQGLALQISESGDSAKSDGCCIAYDSRHMSREFALDTALVLAHNGIRVYLFDDLRPTPELSFSIKHLKCAAGVVITASHNPAAYNGFKVYWRDGGQITPDTANKILAKMSDIEPLTVELAGEAEAREEGLLVGIGAEVDDAYVSHVLSLRPDADLLTRTGVNLKIVYTPLHGSGNKLVRAALKRAGYTDVYVVSEQEAPDGDFPTVASPNPENAEAFDMAVGYAERVGADIIIGTDPDSDRMGMMLKRDGKWSPVTGNQAGCLMLEYILKARPNVKDAYCVTTVVSTRMVDAICAKNSASVARVLTGFKYIGEAIDVRERAGNNGFLLGFEESYGYLTGGYIRDKDAVIASLLACEMAAYYKSKGMTVFDALDQMHKEYGYFAEKTLSVTMPGIDGIQKRERATAEMRKNPPKEIGGLKVLEAFDFSAGGVMGLPKADVLLYMLENSAWLCVRPSGTEPKLKIYAGVKEQSEAQASAAVEALLNAAKKFGE